MNKIKEWWNTTSKDNDAAKSLFDQTIDGYNFVYSSGHQANVFANKNGKELQIFSFSDPDTPQDFYEKLKNQLNRITGGKKHKTRRNIKSKKSRKGKSLKNRRKSTRSRR